MEQIVTGCGDCMFLRKIMGVMDCGHPYWRTEEGKIKVMNNPYEYCVITQGEKFPKECPLNSEPITIIKK